MLSHFMYLVMAISVHTSAWILIPIVYMAHKLNLSRKKISLSSAILFTLLAVGVFIILPQLLNALNLWPGYLAKDTISRSVVPRSLVIFATLSMCVKYHKILSLSNSYIAFLWAGFLLNIGGLFIAYFERVGYYLTLLFPLVIIVVMSQSTSNTQRRLSRFLISLLGIMYFVAVYYLMGSSGIFPYSF